MTAGLSAASFCRIANAARFSDSASFALPVSRQQPAEVVVACARSAAEHGDGGVLRGQLLPDRNRLRGTRLRLLLLGPSCPAAQPMPPIVFARSRRHSFAAPAAAASASWSAPRPPICHQRLLVLADRGQEGKPSEPRQRGQLGAPASGDPGAGRPAGPRPHDTSPAPVGLPRRLEQPGDRHQAPADLRRRRRVRPPARPPAPAAPPAPTGAPPARPPCGRPWRSAPPARIRPRQRPPRRRRPSPCPAAPRACRRTRRPTSAAGPAGP